MANFLENPNVQYNAPVQTAPLAALAAVGMQKQVLYNEGVERIQGQIDQTAALPVSRDVDKAYLNQSLANLGTELKKLSTADFSQMQIQNSTAGMTSKISKDKNIQAAVYSTIHDQSNQTLMDEDRKKGTLTPDNEFYYQKQRQEYLNSTDLGRQFNGKYIPNFDVFKFAKETFDAVKPDGYTIEQIYLTNADGSIKQDKNGNPIYSPTMVTLEKEGRFPEKVKETIAQIFSDPRVGQQLSITGQYNYRGYDGDPLANMVEIKRKQATSAISEKLLELGIAKSSGKDVSKDIEMVSGLLDNKNTYYDQYKRLAYENPEAVRSALYKDDVTDKYTTMFGYSKITNKTTSNPGWEANFKTVQEQNRISEFVQNLQQRKQEHNDSLKWKGLEYEQKERLARLKGSKGKLNEDGTYSEQETTLDNITSSYDIVANAEGNLKDQIDGFSKNVNEFIYSTAFKAIPSNVAKLQDLLQKGNTREQAIEIMLNNAAKANNESPVQFKARWMEKSNSMVNANPNSVTKEVKEAQEIAITSKKGLDYLTNLQTGAEKAAIANGITDIDLSGMVKGVRPLTGMVNGNNITLSPEDQVQLAVVLAGDKYASSLGMFNNANTNKKSKAAEANLRARGLGDVVDLLDQLKNTINPLSPITDTYHDIKNAWNKTNISVKSILDLSKKINTDAVDKAYSVKAEYYKSHMGVQPNLKINLYGDKPAENKIMADKLANLAGSYTDKGNLSPDFKNFVEEIHREGTTFDAHVVPSFSGDHKIEVVTYGVTGKRTGAVTVARDEAEKVLGIDVDALYEPREVAMLKTAISVNGGQSTHGDPRSIGTYISEPSSFDKKSFPSLANSKYDVKVNFTQSNGKYFPYMYVSDGVRTIIKDLPGDADLNKLQKSLKTVVNPGYAELILTQNK